MPAKKPMDVDAIVALVAERIRTANDEGLTYSPQAEIEIPVATYARGGNLQVDAMPLLAKMNSTFPLQELGVAPDVSIEALQEALARRFNVAAKEIKISPTIGFAADYGTRGIVIRGLDRLQDADAHDRNTGVVEMPPEIVAVESPALAPALK